MKFSRTVNSFVKILARHFDVKFVFISTEEFEPNEELIAHVNCYGKIYEKSSSLEESIKKIDVLYMTRIQTERIKHGGLNSIKVNLKLTNEILEKASKNLIVMHPLPKLNEIEFEVDSNFRAAYFKQAENGIYARMALIETVLTTETAFKLKGKILNCCCSNENCITQFEKNLPKSFIVEQNQIYCEFCGKFVK